MVSETRSDDAEEIGRNCRPVPFIRSGINLILRRCAEAMAPAYGTGWQGGSNEREKHTGFDTADITAPSHLYRGDRSTVRRNLRERVTSGLT